MTTLVSGSVSNVQQPNGPLKKNALQLNGLLAKGPSLHFEGTYPWIKDLQLHGDVPRDAFGLSLTQILSSNYAPMYQAYCPTNSLASLRSRNYEETQNFHQQFLQGMSQAEQQMKAVRDPLALQLFYRIQLTTDEQPEGLNSLVNGKQIAHQPERIIQQVRRLQNQLYILKARVADENEKAPVLKAIDKMQKALNEIQTRQAFVLGANNWVARSAEGLTRDVIHTQAPEKMTLDLLERNWTDLTVANHYRQQDPQSALAYGAFYEQCAPLLELLSQSLQDQAARRDTIDLHRILTQMGRPKPLALDDLAETQNLALEFNERLGRLEASATNHPAALGQIQTIRSLLATFVKDKGLVPVADVAVVGLGPAGLAMCINGMERNLRMVGFEGGFVGQSFSDQGADAVHYMRTSRLTTTCAFPGVTPQDIVDRYSLPNVINRERFDLKGQAVSRGGRNLIQMGNYGRDSLSERTGIRFWGEPQIKNYDTRLEASCERSVFFQYMTWLGDQIAKHPNASISENSPVISAKKDPDTGLYRIKTADGQEVLARFLVVANGLVGSDSQYSKFPDVLEGLAQGHEQDYLFLRDHAQLKTVETSEKFAHYVETTCQNKRNPKPQQQIIMADSLLGTPEAWTWLRNLPEGTSIGLIGSGESAAKALVEILIKSTRDQEFPRLKVDMFIKENLEPYQVQVQPNAFDLVSLVEGLLNPSSGEKLRQYWAQYFNTPITPQTMHDILSFVQSGNVRVFELGPQSKFDSKNVTMTAVKTADGVKTQIRVKSPEVLAHLLKQKADWEAFGMKVDHYDLPLLQPGQNAFREAKKLLAQSGNQAGNQDGYLLSEIDGGFVSAIGYDRKARRSSGLLQDLEQQGLMEFIDSSSSGAPLTKGETNEIRLGPDRFTSAKDPTLAFIGASNFSATASDSAIPGGAARASLLTQLILNDMGNYGRSSNLAVVQGRFRSQLRDSSTDRRLRDLEPDQTYYDVLDHLQNETDPTRQNPKVSPGLPPILGYGNGASVDKGIKALRAANAATNPDEQARLLLNALGYIAYPQHELILGDFLRQAGATSMGSTGHDPRASGKRKKKQVLWQMDAQRTSLSPEQCQVLDRSNRQPMKGEKRLMAFRAIQLLSRVVDDPNSPGQLRDQTQILCEASRRLLQNPHDTDFLAFLDFGPIIQAFEDYQANHPSNPLQAGP